MFGEIGEKPGGMETRICTVNEVDTGAICTAKLVMAKDAQVLFRLSPNGNNGYKTVFKVEPLDE